MVDVFALAVRLLRGEVVEITDDAGRTWQATASSLSVLWYGEPEPLLEGIDAYEVARELARRTVQDIRFSGSVPCHNSACAGPI